MEYLITGEFTLDAYDSNFNTYSDKLMPEINSFIHKRHYGSGIELFTHVLRIGLIDTYTPTKQFIRKTKEIIVSTDLNKGDINFTDYALFRSELLKHFIEAINTASTMKSSPKGFDFNKLRGDIQDLIKRVD